MFSALCSLEAPPVPFDPWAYLGSNKLREMSNSINDLGMALFCFYRVFDIPTPLSFLRTVTDILPDPFHHVLWPLLAVDPRMDKMEMVSCIHPIENQ